MFGKRATRHTGSRLAALVLALVSGAAMAADEDVAEAGKARFMEFCAVCHGADAKGGGPFKPMLTKAPLDLTVLAKNNGGVFPFDRVYDMVDGRTMPGAHGTQEMPIWGATWRTDSGVGAETEIRGRVLELIIYLRSIQQ